MALEEMAGVVNGTNKIVVTQLYSKRLDEFVYV